MVPTGTLPLAALFAAPLFKISTLDVANARSLPLLMRSFALSRPAKVAKMEAFFSLVP